MTTHTHDLGPWRHSHRFDAGNREGETRTHWVLALTLVTMFAEVAAGWWTGSMALLADGWHMGTHALALGIAALAYAVARRHGDDSRYAFGTWKIEVLGGFASALVLVLVALAIAAESALRLWRAEPVAAQTALIVAVIGLVVNLISAWLLHGSHTHGSAHAHHAHAGHDTGHGQRRGHEHVLVHEHEHHDHDHDHDHDHAHHAHHAHGHADHGRPHPGAAQARAAGNASGADLNLRGAYLHVLADALTSVLAIAALSAALWLGWWWLDPLVGVLGAVVIAVWAKGLLRESANVLLDREMDHPLAKTLRTALEADGDAKVADLHLWRVGREQFAAIVCIVADAPLAPAAYRERLSPHHELVHVSVEVNRCAQAEAAPG
ncbi:MAG: cation diffusion facilitator family transporter [Burkholderiaceae bacterium]